MWEHRVRSPPRSRDARRTRMSAAPLRVRLFILLGRMLVLGSLRRIQEFPSERQRTKPARVKDRRAGAVVAAFKCAPRSCTFGVSPRKDSALNWIPEVAVLDARWTLRVGRES